MMMTRLRSLLCSNQELGGRKQLLGEEKRLSIPPQLPPPSFPLFRCLPGSNHPLSLRSISISNLAWFV